MKQAFMCIILLAMVTVAKAQKLSNNKVPAAVKDGFAAAHPGAKASWEKEEGDCEANFTEAGKKMSCVLNGKGIILETETEMAVTELPARAKEHIAKTYKGIAAKGAAKIVSADGTITYEADVKKKELLFDSNGMFLKEVKD